MQLLIVSCIFFLVVAIAGLVAAVTAETAFGHIGYAVGAVLLAVIVIDRAVRWSRQRGTGR